MDIPLLIRELFATGVSSFFAADVIIAIVILIAAAALDDRLPPISRVIVSLLSLLGASAGVAAYLLLRERARRLGDSESGTP